MVLQVWDWTSNLIVTIMLYMWSFKAHEKPPASILNALDSILDSLRTSVLFWTLCGPRFSFGLFAALGYILDSLFWTLCGPRFYFGLFAALGSILDSFRPSVLFWTLCGPRFYFGLFAALGSILDSFLTTPFIIVQLTRVMVSKFRNVTYKSSGNN